ncbi:MAG: hypothetical protein LC134_09680 [Chitinophagales bacterium]|nr:hypothetical protein [Chitinophagales bacterium]
MTLKFKMLFALLFVTFIFVRAQEKDTTKKSFVDSVKALTDTAKVKVTDSSKTNATDTTKANVDSFYSTTSTAKVIKKIEDPRLGLSYEFIARIKRMKPNQLLIIDEKAVRNEKRVDEYGLEYEATVAIRFSFSQDMITGIVKETPLYNTAGRETNIIDVKIPIKFCCTTPMDSVHKKKHCGKMSELNDFEDNEGCKDWVQVEAGSGGSKKSTGKPIVKGKGRTGQTSITGESDDNDDEEVDKFGKPISKKKKGKKSKQQLEDENIEVSDSTTVNYQDSVVTDKSKKTGKKVKESKKKKNDESFGKPTKKDKNNKSKSNDDDENEKTYNEVNKNQEDSTGVAPPKQEVQGNKEEKKENKKEEKQTKQKKDNSANEDEAASFKKENKKEKKKKNKEKPSEVNFTDTTSKASKEIIEDKKEDSKNDSSSEEEVTTDKKTKKKEKKKKKEEKRKEDEKKENEIDE